MKLIIQPSRSHLGPSGPLSLQRTHLRKGQTHHQESLWRTTVTLARRLLVMILSIYATPSGTSKFLSIEYLIVNAPTGDSESVAKFDKVLILS